MKEMNNDKFIQMAKVFLINHQQLYEHDRGGPSRLNNGTAATAKIIKEFCSLFHNNQHN